MESPSEKDLAQKEIKYYKERLKKLTSSYMSLEYRSADLAKDVFQMSEGLQVIAELQHTDPNSNVEELLENLTESINVRLKMDVTLFLMPKKNHPYDFQAKYVKAFSSYDIDRICAKTITVPELLFNSKTSIICNQEGFIHEFAEVLRVELEIEHFVLTPVIHNNEILAYIFTGRRPQLLQTGTGILPYHQNILEAISGVISAVQNQLDRNIVLEEKVAKRTAELNKEKEVSEELLLNILPYETTIELKKNGFVKAKEFNVVTVLFTDFKNFTKYSEGLSSHELVAEIDFYYRTIDGIVGKYGIEKIKTIGDSYMCAAGLPVKKEGHARDAIMAALEIRDFVEKTKQDRIKKKKHYFEIRIGLNSGPVIAGIVGVKKFAYDIWGDTVNIASRMESSCEPGKVNISDNTYQLVKNDFEFAYRGKIDAKNIGKIDMYYVEKK